jgi:hypothetical protein
MRSFQGERRMAVQQAVQPAQEGSVMFQQPGPGAETTSFRTWASVDVVVKLQVTDAQVADQEIGDFVQVLDRRRMPQVKVVPAVLHHPLAGPRGGAGRHLPRDAQLRRRTRRAPATTTPT